jgi:hypothetical protein
MGHTKRHAKKSRYKFGFKFDLKITFHVSNDGRKGWAAKEGVKLGGDSSHVPLHCIANGLHKENVLKLLFCLFKKKLDYSCLKNSPKLVPCDFCK